MADGDELIAYAPHPNEEPEDIANHLQQRRLLDAGRILVLGDWLAVTASFGANPDANASHVLAGFVLLLLGVSLIMLSPVANQFPGAARVGAGLANIVLSYFLAPGH